MISKLRCEFRFMLTTSSDQLSLLVNRSSQYRQSQQLLATDHESQIYPAIYSILNFNRVIGIEMILNQTQLTEMQELLGDNFTMLLDIFLRDSKTQIEQISEWDDTSKNSAVLREAHNLKSSAANLGLDQLATQCDLIEAALHTDKTEDVSGLVENIDELYKESITALVDATSA